MSDILSVNKFQFEDPVAQKFSNLWFEQRLTLTPAQKDDIVMAYVEHALGLGRALARGFSKGWGESLKKVGDRLSGYENQPGMEKFWRHVRKRFSKCYTREDVHFLANGGNIAAWHMFFQFKLHSNSNLVTRLMELASAYK